MAPAAPDVPRLPDVAVAEPHDDATRRGHAVGNGEDVVLTIGKDHVLVFFSRSLSLYINFLLFFLYSLYTTKM